MSAINWNASIQFPSDSCFVNRIISAKFAPSNSGNPMITIESEVVQPETYNVGGQDINIAGVKVKSYYTCKVMEGDVVNEEKTAQARSRVFVSANPEQPSLWDKLGLDGSKEDPENPNVKQLEGICFYAQMSSRPDEQRKTPTAEQIALAKSKGQRALGDIMKNPVTGKALCKYWPQIDEIFGVAEVSNLPK